VLDCGERQTGADAQRVDLGGRQIAAVAEEDLAGVFVVAAVEPPGGVAVAFSERAVDVAAGGGVVDAADQDMQLVTTL